MEPGQRPWISVDPDCQEHPFAREILAASQGHGRASAVARQLPHFPGLRLSRHLGRFLKPCPGTRNYLCCGYRVLNLVLGCPYGCTYCILQNYLEGPQIQVFVNLFDALWEVEDWLKGRRGIWRVGTGELGDSLALEPLIPFSQRLVPFFARLPNAILELKTKSCQVGALLDLPHGGHTVISFSLNPPLVAARAEPLAPSPEERVWAARLCQEKGYPVGIHLDPLVMLEGWEEAYRGLLERLFGSLDPGGILWISMGALRYPRSMHPRMVEGGLGLGEMVPGLDGKMRYLRPLRSAMFRTLARWIRELAGPIPLLYLCMESREVWREALGFAPRSMAQLDQMFQERVRGYWSSRY